MPHMEVLGHKIYYIQEGETGDPILFVHGVPTSSYQWQAVQSNLSHKYRTYNIDLIGMGKSDKPLDGWDYTFENDAKIIAALLDEWGIERVNFCGDDWGGGIGLVFAHNYPDRVSRLMVFDPVAYDHWPVPPIEYVGRLQELGEGIIVAPLDRFLTSPLNDLSYRLSFIMRSMVYKPSVLDDLELRKYREPYETVDYSQKGKYGEPKLDGIKALIRRANALDPKWMLNLDLSKITVPVLVGWGAEDIYMSPKGMDRLKADLGGPVRTELIEEAGHLAMLDKPDAVTNMIDDFIGKQEAAAA